MQKLGFWTQPKKAQVFLQGKQYWKWKYNRKTSNRVYTYPWPSWLTALRIRSRSLIPTNLPRGRKSRSESERRVQLIAIVVLYDISNSCDSLCVLIGGVTPDEVQGGTLPGVTVTAREVNTHHKVQLTSTLWRR